MTADEGAQAPLCAYDPLSDGEIGAMLRAADIADDNNKAAND